MKGIKCLVLVAVTVMAVMLLFAAPVSAGDDVSLDGKHGGQGENPGFGGATKGEWSQPENPGAWGGQKPAKKGPGPFEVAIGLYPSLVTLF